MRGPGNFFGKPLPVRSRDRSKDWGGSPEENGVRKALTIDRGRNRLAQLVALNPGASRIVLERPGTQIDPQRVGIDRDSKVEQLNQSLLSGPFQRCIVDRANFGGLSVSLT